MLSGDIVIEDFRRLVVTDYGEEIAHQFMKQLGRSGTTSQYSDAMKALNAVLAKHPIATYSGPTTFRGSIHLVT